MRNIVKRVELADFDARVRFLERFARRTLKGGFAVFHETRGHGPQAMPRFYAAAAQQDFVFPLGYAADDHARILVVDGGTRDAHEARQRVAFGYAQFYRCAAITAEFHWEWRF